MKRIPFQRKPGLGHYNASRTEWHEAYRAARVAIGNGAKPDHRLDGVRWKAQLIVAYERDGEGDPLQGSARGRLAVSRFIDEILGEVGR
ncbi:hypothetical protein PZT57_25985 [Pseudomonas aeruginosa]|nr:hypothetical protein [Pseudomonas aeruginosa]